MSMKFLPGIFLLLFFLFSSWFYSNILPFNFLLLTPLYFVYKNKLSLALITAFLAGLVFDLVNLGSLGLSSLFFLSSTYFFFYLLKKTSKDNLIFFTVFVFLNDLLFNYLLFTRLQITYSLFFAGLSLFIFLLIFKTLSRFKKDQEIYLT